MQETKTMANIFSVTAFPKLFSRILNALSFKRESEDDLTIAHREPISRYIFNKRHFRRLKGTVEYGAFLPNPKNNETSVFRVKGLSEDRIWNIGFNHVAKDRIESLKSRADILSTDISILSDNVLSVVKETSSHKLHANIVGWPSEDHEQIMLATELANESKLVLPPK
ncbi:hypothetical protein [Sulfuriflexus mobilis]|uniref:hypothetical protein n=1 Tax=Sulfuriflexus mobilis TaxID=1811807 RepID=UPI000F822CA7|nr:hypothetical protein [Sulfuriflexus mobilis]